MSRRRPAAAVAAVACTCLLLGAALALLAPSAAAQDGPGSQAPTSSTIAVLPPADMIPRPNSGQQPVDAGDRGGSLQLLVLGLVLVGIGAGVAKLVRDSRRARAGRSGLG